MRRSRFSYPYVVWMVIFIAAPMLLILYYALTKNGAFTLDGFVRAVDPIYGNILLRSVWLALKATVICLVLGYPVAYLLSRMKRSTAGLLSVLFILPMWMNFLLRTYAWQVLLDGNGPIAQLFQALGGTAPQMLYTEFAVTLGTVYNFLPFMILPLYTVLSKMDPSHVEAAHDLGAGQVTTFFRVVFPLSVPGIVSGVTMVFVPAITQFAISRLLGGGMYALYGDLIESQFLQMSDWTLGSAFSVILLVLLILSTVLMRWAERAAGVRTTETEGGMPI